MKRHETLHIGSPKTRRATHARSMRRMSSNSRAGSSIIDKSHTHQGASKQIPLGLVEEHLAPSSPLSDNTDTSPTVPDYFPPLVADPAPQDLGNDLGELGTLDPLQMSSTNWLPPAPSGQLSLDPFNVLMDGQPHWAMPPAVPPPHSNGSVATSPLEIPGAAYGMPDMALPQTIPSQIKRMPSADALGCESPRSFSSVDSSEHSSQAPSGEFYVDGGATRLPKGRKRRTSVHSTQGISPGYGSHTSRLTLANNHWDGQRNQHPHFLNGFNYGLMLEVFQQTCSQAQSSFQPFEEDVFLSLPVIDDLIALAVEHFLPTLPFIHTAKLRTQGCSWVLYLALATIGTHYEINILDERVFSMNEFLRRALAWVEVSI